MDAGSRYMYFGYCKDCFAIAPDSAITMNKPVYAMGVGHSGGFMGIITMDVALPPGAAFPTVSSVTLASK